MGTSVRTSLHGRVWLKLILALAFLFAGLALAWMIVIPVAVADFVRRQTGCGTEIGSLYANPFTAHLVVKHLELTNPAAFPRKDFIAVRELEVEAHPLSLLAGRRVIDRAVLDVASITVVRDRQGRVNVRLLEHGPAAAGAAAPGTADRAPEGGVLIRRLEVRLDRVVVADYASQIPDVREYRLNFHHTYTNVTSAGQLAEPLAALGNLGAAVDRLLPEWSGRLRRTGGLIEEAGRKTGATLKGLIESLEKSLRQ